MAVAFCRAPPGCWHDWKSQAVRLQRGSQGYGDLAKRSKFAVPHQGIGVLNTFVCPYSTGMGRSPSLPSPAAPADRRAGSVIAPRKFSFAFLPLFRLLGRSWGHFCRSWTDFWRSCVDLSRSCVDLGCFSVDFRRFWTKVSKCTRAS